MKIEVELPPALVEDLAARVAAIVLEQLRAEAVLERAEPWRLVGVDDVARALGRSRRWVHAAIRDRSLPHIRIDQGSLRFNLRDVEAWARARSVPAADDLSAGAAQTVADRLHPSGKTASGQGLRDRSLPANQKVEGR